MLFHVLIILPWFSLSAYSQWVTLDSIASSVEHISTSGGKLYVCSATTGVYISTDSGSTWNPSNNCLTNLSTRRILARDSLLVLGTNSAIFKSIDYGATWALSFTGTPPGTGCNVSDIIFRGDSILAATNGSGIFCSLDFCQTWFPLNNGFPDLNRSCLFSDGSRLFTGTWTAGSGIFCSDDNGATWIPKNNGVPMMWSNPEKYVDITSITKVNQSLFASSFGGNVLKSEDNGESWTILNNPNNYEWIIWSPGYTLLCGHNGVGVSRSDDLGNTWIYQNEGLGPPYDIDICTFCLMGSYIYAGGWNRKIFRCPVSEITTSIRENEIKTGTRVYPNPISEYSTIVVPVSKNEKYRFEVFNDGGICIKNLSGLNPVQLTLRKSDYQKGIYFFRITGSGQDLFNGKFIVD